MLANWSPICTLLIGLPSESKNLALTSVWVAAYLAVPCSAAL